MPNDMLTLKALGSELDDTLKNGRIDKIYQPEIDGVVFLIYAGNKNHTLYMCASGGSSHCNLSNKKFSNPDTAPAFCMLLRKYLSGAKLESVALFNNDRVLDFSFKIKGELFSGSVMHLLFEQMGKYANIVLADDKMVIKDALKRITSSETRLIMPGQAYLPEPLRKTPATELEAVKKILENSVISVALNTEIGGISKETEKELLMRAENSPALLLAEIEKFGSIYGAADYSPSVRFENGAAKGYYFTEYRSLQGEYEKRGSLSLAIEEFFANSHGEIKRDERFKKLNKAVKKLIDKYERRLSDAEMRILAASDAEKERQTGDLITSSLHLLKKGDSTLTCYDYFDGIEREIPLDNMLSPQGNAAAFYKRYAKLKRGGEYGEKEKTEAIVMLEYLLSVKESLNFCFSGNDYLELEEELYSLGGLVRQNKGKKKTVRPQFVENVIGGFKILTGKNNIQNNELTFNVADGRDIWMHAKKLHGSHTVIKTEGRKIPDFVLICAAEITAYFSGGRASGKVEVDYTERKNVKRRPNAPLGMVNYTNFKTLSVEPKEKPSKQF